MTRTRNGGRDLIQFLLVMASLIVNFSVTAFSVPPVPTTRTTSSRSPPNQAWERSALSELQETQVQGQTVQGPTLPTGADYGAYCVSSASSCTQETEPTILECPSLPSDFPIGTYYRNGGARFESDDGTLVVHPFDADGMVCAATFDPTNQRILFRNAFVETEGYLEDKSTGKMTKRESLEITEGKITELTPYPIPESLAYAYQEAGDMENAMKYYKLALEGIRTFVMRQKTDAIVLNACLVQSQFNKEEALRMAFEFSPHYSDVQQFGIVGAGRGLLVQQCEAWASDLLFPSIDAAKAALTKKE